MTRQIADTLPAAVEQQIPLEEFLVGNWHMDWCDEKDARQAVAEKERGGLLRYDAWLENEPEAVERRRQETNRRHAAWDAEAQRIVANLPPGPRRIVFYRARWWIVCAAAVSGPYLLPPGALEAR